MLHLPLPGPTVASTHDRRSITRKGITMGFLGKAIKSGLAVKAAQIIQREAQKPENQRKAKELLVKMKSRKK